MTIVRRLARPNILASNPASIAARAFSGDITADNPSWRSSAVLDEWVQREARPISLRQLTVFGRTLTKERLLSSANYVREELPTRLAHRIRDMQTLPYAVVTNPHISHVYDIYKSAFEKLRSFGPIRSLEDNDAYCKMLTGSLTEHLTAIPRLAMGVLQVQDVMQPEAIDKFMTTLLRSRISRRVIAEQHLALTDHFATAKAQHDPNADFIGEIFLKCNAKEVVETCAATMRTMITKDLGDDVIVPEVEIEGHLNATFPYILSHLEYIIGEMLRNSMQAVIDRHEPEGEPVAPIKVLICEASEHVIFRISDRGGGIPRDVFRHLWSFSKGPHRDTRLKNLIKVPKLSATMQELSTSSEPGGPAQSWPQTSRPDVRQSSLGSLTGRPANLRLGVGLPMSKVYAEYWAGRLEMHSLEGFGTDAFLMISKFGNKNEQLSTRASMDAM